MKKADHNVIMPSIFKGRKRKAGMNVSQCPLEKDCLSWQGEDWAGEITAMKRAPAASFHAASPSLA